MGGEINSVLKKSHRATIGGRPMLPLLTRSEREPVCELATERGSAGAFGFILVSLNLIFIVCLSPERR